MCHLILKTVATLATMQACRTAPSGNHWALAKVKYTGISRQLSQMGHLILKTVATLANAGMSNRAIGQSLGISRETVRQDRQSIGKNLPMPDRVTTTDGRSYPARREPKQRNPLFDAAPDRKSIT